MTLIQVASPDNSMSRWVSQLLPRSHLYIRSWCRIYEATYRSQSKPPSQSRYIINLASATPTLQLLTESNWECLPEA